MIRRTPTNQLPINGPTADGAALDDIERLLDALPYPDDERHPTRVVRAACLARARFITRPDFDTLSVPDLELLFDLYDQHAFDGLLSRILPAGSPGRPVLRVSNRMTRTAGKTVHRRTRISTLTSHEASSLEIAISAPLLGVAIESEQGVPVVGLRCRDRLDILQRVFEHELVHALMFCLGGDARCSRETFRSIAFGLFGHLESTHGMQLDTPQQRVTQLPGDSVTVRPGDRVRFDFRGNALEGVINRITRRATVLVQDPRGKPYTDGVRYTKFYVPLPMLRPVSDSSSDG